MGEKEGGREGGVKTRRRRKGGSREGRGDERGMDEGRGREGGTRRRRGSRGELLLYGRAWRRIGARPITAQLFIMHGK